MQGRTLQEVSDRADITKSLLSKIENGKSAPPIATLTRIAKVLGVGVSSLLSDADQGGAVFVPAEDARKTVKTDKGYSFFSFAGQRHNKIMQVYQFSARKGEVKPQALSHRGEEFVFMLEGCMRYSVGSTQYTLEAGDALYFDSEEDHDLESVTDDVKYLAVFCDRRESGAD